MDKTLNYLAIAMKAGLLVTGEDNTGISVRAGKARLVLLADDASDNARSRARSFLFGRDVPMVTVPNSKEEIGCATGKNLCSMAAVTDIGLAVSIARSLADTDEGKYGETLALLTDKQERMNKRMAESKAHDRNKKTGRRKKA